MQATACELGFGRRPALDLPYGAEGTVPTRVAQAVLGGEPQDLVRRVQRNLPGAVPRRLALAGGDNLNVAIGQGDLQVSPLQLALGYGALANGGTVYRPRVGAVVLDPASGRVVRRGRAPGRRGGRGRRRPGRRRPGLASVPSGDGGVRLRRVPAGPSRWPARPARPTRRPRRCPPGSRRTPRWGPAVRGRGHGRAGRPRRRVGRFAARAIYQKLFGLPVTPGGPRGGTERLMQESGKLPDRVAAGWGAGQRPADGLAGALAAPGPDGAAGRAGPDRPGAACHLLVDLRRLRAQGLPEAAIMRRQLLNLGLGLAVMVAAMVVDYRRLQAWAGGIRGRGGSPRAGPDPAGVGHQRRPVVVRARRLPGPAVRVRQGRGHRHPGRRARGQAEAPRPAPPGRRAGRRRPGLRRDPAPARLRDVHGVRGHPVRMLLVSG